ncbi:hypothetical protein C3K47_04610 [Solitalea longa]|uniref:DUF4468 domain-containing protein n=1 Tax=Solitalea longa TaxID=2079460 RepID=A0A2S5A680_9SPHI|nr:hypothetical protein [Solitalea longa]POY37819.1 hypothetical protein C3K47_04610 [Solitalea longa]
MKKLLFLFVFLLPLTVLAQNAPAKTSTKTTVKKTTKPVDTTIKKQAAKAVDSTLKPAVKSTQDSVKKSTAKKTAKPADSLAKKSAVKPSSKAADSLKKATAKKTVKPVDSLTKKSTVKATDSLKKSAAKKSVKGTDSLSKKSTGKKSVAVSDSTKKAAIKGAGRPLDSLSKKSATAKKTKAIDSLSKKGNLKLSPKQLDSLKKASTKKNVKATDSAKKALAKGEKPPVIKGWFEISGADSTDLKESLLKKNSEEWFTTWFAPLNDRYPTFKTSVPDSINQSIGYYSGHGSNAFEDQLAQNRTSKIKMDYKTEVRVKGKVYQYRFYDFKIKSTLSQNGKVISEETITDIDEEKEKNRQAKDQYKAWRIKRVQDEMQLILDSFQSIMLQTPQRLNSFE